MNGNVIQTSSIFSLKVLDGHVRVQEVTAITYPASQGHLSLEELQMLLICKQETSIFVKLPHKMQILEYIEIFALVTLKKIQLSSVQAKIRG